MIYPLYLRSPVIPMPLFFCRPNQAPLRASASASPHSIRTRSCFTTSAWGFNELSYDGNDPDWMYGDWEWDDPWHASSLGIYVDVEICWNKKNLEITGDLANSCGDKMGDNWDSQLNMMCKGSSDNWVFPKMAILMERWYHILIYSDGFPFPDTLWFGSIECEFIIAIWAIW